MCIFSRNTWLLIFFALVLGVFKFLLKWNIIFHNKTFFFPVWMFYKKDQWVQSLHYCRWSLVPTHVDRKCHGDLFWSEQWPPVPHERLSWKTALLIGWTLSWQDKGQNKVLNCFKQVQTVQTAPFTFYLSHDHQTPTCFSVSFNPFM